MSELSIPATQTLSLRERDPRWAAHLDKLDVRQEKTVTKLLRQELGLIATLSVIHTDQTDSECYIVSYEPRRRRNDSLRTEHLAWDLGAEDTTAQDDEYAQHLYLARSNRHFYRGGDPGMTTPHTPVPSFVLLRKVRDVRQQLE